MTVLWTVQPSESPALSRAFGYSYASTRRLAILLLRLPERGERNDGSEARSIQGPQAHYRNLLFDALYSSLPRDPQVKVQIYNAEIVPGGYTNWHCHNGAAFFVALQGLFEAHFQEGVLVKAKAGECYSEPIAKFHRGHNPHPELPYLCVGVCFTSPDREHVTNSLERPW